MTIKELREQNKLSQAALAKALGVSSSLIGAIETGTKRVSDNVAAKVKEVYGVVIETAVKTEAKVEQAAKEATEKKKLQAINSVKKTAEKAEKKAAAEVNAAAQNVSAKAKTAAVKAKTTTKKTAAKAAAKVEKVLKHAPVVRIQSPLGGEITPAEILEKVGNVDTVYVRVDQNKAYWVKGEETGSVDLW